MLDRARDDTVARTPTAGRGATPATPAPPGGAADTVLQLQRAAGNRATVAALGRAPRHVMQRELAYKSDTLVPLMDPAAKGAEGFQKIWTLLAQYHGARLVRDRSVLIEQLDKACAAWLKKYGKPQEARTTEVAKLHDAVGREYQTAGADLKYVEDLRQTAADRKRGIFNTGFAYASSWVGEGIEDTDRLLAGQPDPGRAKYGGGAEAERIMKARGLTDAEMLALKVYTTGDYHTINPALQGDDAWLRHKIPEVAGAIRVGGKALPKPMEPTAPVAPPAPAIGAGAAAHAAYRAALAAYQAAHAAYQQNVAAFPTRPDKVAWDAAVTATRHDVNAVKTIKSDALRHARVVQEALKKLEAFRGTVYRGERKPAADVTAQYGTPNRVLPGRPDFTSSSKSEAEALKWAKGNTPGDGKQGVLLEIHCHALTARDISALSHHGPEDEVLFLPGAKLKVVDTYPANPATHPHLAGVDRVVVLDEVP